MSIFDSENFAYIQHVSDVSSAKFLKYYNFRIFARVRVGGCCQSFPSSPNRSSCWYLNNINICPSPTTRLRFGASRRVRIATPLSEHVPEGWLLSLSSLFSFETRIIIMPLWWKTGHWKTLPEFAYAGPQLCLIRRDERTCASRSFFPPDYQHRILRSNNPFFFHFLL